MLVAASEAGRETMNRKVFGNFQYMLYQLSSRSIDYRLRNNNLKARDRLRVVIILYSTFPILGPIIRHQVSYLLLQPLVQITVVL